MPLLWDTPHLIFLAFVTAIMILLTVSEVIEEKAPRRATDVATTRAGRGAGPNGLRR